MFFHYVERNMHYQIDSHFLLASLKSMSLCFFVYLHQNDERNIFFFGCCYCLHTKHLIEAKQLNSLLNV